MQMDPMDFFEPEELLQIFRCNKTDMSCIEKPQSFLSILKDHNLIPEDRYEKVIRMKSKENMKQGLYRALEWLEKNRSEKIKLFWTCAFKDTIMSQYPILKTLRNSLLDGTYKCYMELPEKVDKEETKGKKRKESLEEGEGEEEQTEMGGKKSKKRSKSVCSEEEQAGPSTRLTPNRRNNSLKGTFSSPLKKGQKSDIWNWPLFKNRLTVTCGKKTGTLDKNKLAKGEKCIMVNGELFTPSQFERMAGREKSKNWKLTIRCGKTPLGKLIQDGHLEYKSYCRRSVKKSLFPSNDLSTDGEEEQDEAVGEDSEDQSSSTEKDISTDSTDAEDEGAMEQQAETEAESSPGNSNTVFKVTCGAATGTLHKNRFATGTLGKSIRTETSWLTPVEFAKEGLSQPEVLWRRDIEWEGQPLAVLIKEKALRIHRVTCECKRCKPDEAQQADQKNDDECYVCRSEQEEDLVVCDNCPRSFHQKCHLPHVDDAILGVDTPWTCTFCIFRNTQECLRPDHCKAALSSNISKCMLQCHYLLLSLFNADDEQIFATNPSSYVKGYSNVVKTPMWFGKVAEKLQMNNYQTVGQFVSDIQLIFTNWFSFNKDNAEFHNKGTRLKEIFESELKNIFSIQQQT